MNITILFQRKNKHYKFILLNLYSILDSFEKKNVCKYKGIDENYT